MNPVGGSRTGTITKLSTLEFSFWLGTCGQDEDTWLDLMCEFGRWLRDPSRNDNEPHFLFLDGHFSHLSLEALEVLDLYGIHVIFLPSHSSHRLQPADLGLQACLKKWLRAAYGALLRSLNQGKLDIPYLNKARVRAAFAAAPHRATAVAHQVHPVIHPLTPVHPPR